MEIKNLFENGVFIEARVFSENDYPKDTEVDFKKFFAEQKSEGYTFLKAITDNGVKKGFWIKEEDYKKLN